MALGKKLGRFQPQTNKINRRRRHKIIPDLIADDTGAIFKTARFSEARYNPKGYQYAKCHWTSGIVAGD